MKNFKSIVLKPLTLVALCLSLPAYAATFNNQHEGDYVIKKFTFHDGKTIDNLKIHYTTLGSPNGQPVLVLHGTTGDGKSMLGESFGQKLFAEGMPLDAAKYYIIIPDSIGSGLSSKPSDGLKGNFPRYDYEDMVNANYQLLKDGLKINHLKLVIGNSMGGMNTWKFVTMYPDYMTAAIPMAATPAPMSSRNWIMRKMVINAIEQDPDWKNGFYKKQPEKFQTVYNYYNIATNGGDIAWQNKAPTTKKTEEVLNNELKKKVTMDTNDFLYQWNAARTFDPTNDLSKIKAQILAINSADDERNPASTGLMDAAIAKIPTAQYYLIPASDKTSGHGTTMTADLWKDQLVKFLEAIKD